MTLSPAVLFVLLIIIAIVLMKGRENFDYYSLRAYGHDLYDTDRLDRYPYNYQPDEYAGRFNYYFPEFYRYGYGNW